MTSQEHEQARALAEDPRLRRVVVDICEPCIKGEGQECHTPGCALWLHKVDLPIHEEHLEDFDKAIITQATPQWTIEKPTKPGWYWWRESSNAEPEAVLTIQSDWEFTAYFIRGRRALVKHVHGEFAGPISPPEETAS